LRYYPGDNREPNEHDNGEGCALVRENAIILRHAASVVCASGDITKDIDNRQSCPQAGDAKRDKGVLLTKFNFF